jgi:hypothetical protein
MPASEPVDPPAFGPNAWGGWNNVEMIRIAANGIKFETATMGQSGSSRPVPVWFP